MSNKEATKVFESIVAHGEDYMDEDDEDQDTKEGGRAIMGPGINTVREAFVSINRQLKPGFGLEIITMVDTGGGNGAKYFHAVVNTAADEVAKSETIFSKSWNPHERAFLRLIIKALVEQSNGNDDDDDEEDNDNDDDEDEDDNRTKKKKASVVGLRRADLINLRSELEGGFKLTLDQATQAIGILLEEKWVRVSASTDAGRRESVQGTLELAPRSYMELYHFITGMGMEADKLPQFLYHRD